MKKRFLSLALALSLVLAFVPAGMAANVSGLKEVVPADKYDSYTYLGEGMIQVGVYGSDWDYKCGLIDTSGKEILAPKYDYIYPFENGVAVVSVYDEEELCGLIDTTGKEIVAPKYGFIGFSEGLAVVRVGDYDTGKWGVIDATGKEIAAPQYDRVWDFKGGAAPVRVGDWDTGKYGFIDTTGKEIVALTYDNIGWFSDGLAGVMVGEKWGFIDKTGQMVIEPQYDNFWGFSNGLSPVMDETGKWGVIDKTGKEVVAPNYDGIYGFSSRGMATIQVGDYWDDDVKFGIIDKTGKEVVAPKYDDLYWFGPDVARVRLDYKYGLIDYTGKVIAPLIYDDMYDFSDGVAIVGVGDYWDGKYGLIDMAGNVILEPKYDSINFFIDGLARFSDYDRGIKGIIDTTGKEIFSCDDWFDIITGSLIELNGALLSLTSAKAEGWAVGNIDYAISVGLVPPSLRSDYTSKITRAEVCALTVALYETITGGEITARKSFTDDGGDVNIQKLGGLGIVNGNGDGTFGPSGEFDRQTMAAITVNFVEKLTGNTLAESTATFTDISKAEGWAQGHIGKVQKAGLMNGSGDGTFDPLTKLDRQMAISLMKNLYEKYK